MCQLESVTQTRVYQTWTGSLLLSRCRNHIVCTVQSHNAVQGQASPRLLRLHPLLQQRALGHADSSLQ